MPPSLEHLTLQPNGVKLHLALAGPPNGQPLVLLHGFPEFWRGWRHQIEPLTQAGYRLIIPDQRGYNLSEAPKDLRSYRLDELTKDILGILDHFGIQQTFLAGHDWGAVVAWTLALQYQQRVKKLGILNVPHPAVMMEFLAKSPRQRLKSWYIGFFQIPGLAERLMGLGNFAGAINLLKASGKPSTFSAEDLEEYRKACANAGGLTGMINWYRALMRFRPAMPRDLRLKMPVLILWGKQDVALSYEMAEESLRYCTDGNLVAFENATHWLQHDEPEAVAAQLIRFFHSSR